MYCNSTVPRKGRMLYIFFFLFESAKELLKLAICWLNSLWGFTLTFIGHNELGITIVSPFCTNSFILPIFEQNFAPKYSESTFVPIPIFYPSIILAIISLRISTSNLSLLVLNDKSFCYLLRISSFEWPETCIIYWLNQDIYEDRVTF